jgi:acyl dehydratase
MEHANFRLETALEFVGRELGVSDWIGVTQARINQFAECTGDHQWIHVDLDRARREGPFGTTIAHGYLTLALVAETIFDVVVQPAGIAQALNYGLERVRFIAPVKSESRVRNRLRLIAADPKADERTLLTIENVMEIEGESKPALIATALVAVSR